MISITTSAGFAWFSAVVGILALGVSFLVKRSARPRALIIAAVAILTALYLFFSGSVTLL
jgi:hypothetical protein